jgi:hypothetical protein
VALLGLPGLAALGAREVNDLVLLIWCRVYWALVWLDRRIWRPIANLKS